ncbi:MAG TPA: transcriptional regulator [Methanomicrobia archaeon]|nr:transcriptional regulator [Methanomicrobia archaeon]
MAGTQLEVLLKQGLKASLKKRFKKRRTKFDILVDILEVSRNGALKTQIVYRANLNYNRIDRYLKTLEQNGLLVNAEACYTTTEKGEEFLREYSNMRLVVT